MVVSQTTSITPSQHADQHRTGGTDPLTGAVGINAISPPADHRTRHEPGGPDEIVNTQEYAVSDAVLHTNAAEQSTASASFVKLKETVLGVDVPGTLRIKIWIRNSNAAAFVYGTIYRNGGAVGAQQSVQDNAWTEKSQDIAGWSAGDLLQVYIKEQFGSNVAYVKDLKICGTVTETVQVLSTADITDQDP